MSTHDPGSNCPEESWKEELQSWLCRRYAFYVDSDLLFIGICSKNQAASVRVLIRQGITGRHERFLEIESDCDRGGSWVLPFEEKKSIADRIDGLLIKFEPDSMRSPSIQEPLACDSGGTAGGRQIDGGEFSKWPWGKGFDKACDSLRLFSELIDSCNPLQGDLLPICHSEFADFRFALGETKSGGSRGVAFELSPRKYGVAVRFCKDYLNVLAHGVSDASVESLGAGDDSQDDQKILLEGLKSLVGREGPLAKKWVEDLNRLKEVEASGVCVSDRSYAPNNFQIELQRLTPESIGELKQSDDFKNLLKQVLLVNYLYFK
ncbi:hypothetical protein ACUH9O_00795 [Dermabacteraceae bacterium P13103]